MWVVLLGHYCAMQQNYVCCALWQQSEGQGDGQQDRQTYTQLHYKRGTEILHKIGDGTGILTHNLHVICGFRAVATSVPMTVLNNTSTAWIWPSFTEHAEVKTAHLTIILFLCHHPEHGRTAGCNMLVNTLWITIHHKVKVLLLVVYTVQKSNYCTGYDPY